MSISRQFAIISASPELCRESDPVAPKLCQQPRLTAGSCSPLRPQGRNQFVATSYLSVEKSWLMWLPSVFLPDAFPEKRRRADAVAEVRRQSLPDRFVPPAAADPAARTSSGRKTRRQRYPISASLCCLVDSGSRRRTVSSPRRTRSVPATPGSDLLLLHAQKRPFPLLGGRGRGALQNVLQCQKHIGALTAVKRVRGRTYPSSEPWVEQEIPRLRSG